MRRTLVLITMLLLGGAVVNVAVAWGCQAIRFGWPATFARPETNVEKRLIASNGESLATDVRETQYVGYCLREFDLKDSEWDSGEASKYFPRRPFTLYSQSAGLPLHSLTGDIWFHSRDWASHHNQPAQISKPPDLSDVWNVGEQYLPLRPSWPGFAINTIFYAAILWLLFCAPGKMRTAIHCRRGLCPACAYPIGTNEVCTECGAALDPKSEVWLQ